MGSIGAISMVDSEVLHSRSAVVMRVVQLHDSHCTFFMSERYASGGIMFSKTKRELAERGNSRSYAPRGLTYILP